MPAGQASRPSRATAGSTGGARRIVRDGIAKAAQSAARWNDHLKAFYERLVAAGKPKKVVITAVMRKLIVLANKLLKDDRLWSPQGCRLLVSSAGIS